jgi:2-polyprenyl-6-methoxyphenol hydroxylase-like FAD-dependent oxidoreductase
VRGLVIGGGIGGLAAATALQRAGHEAAVYEQAKRLEEVGAGLAVSANAVAALNALGLREQALACGALGRRLVLRTAKGTRLADLRLEPGEESLGIHRAALLEVLYEGAGPANVDLGKRCTGVSQDAAGATASFADGSVERGDFLVGADGIHSVTRTALFGPSQLRYAGYAGWRAVTRLEPELLDPGVFWETWGRGVRFGCVAIGRGRVYWFVAESAPEGASPPPEQAKARFLRVFRDWHAPIREIVESTDDAVLSRTPIYDRKPSERWGEGRITSLGDAAHPMTPNLGQGASQALEDAVVLGKVAGEHADPAALLREYERQRTRRASMIVRRSRQAGRLGQAHNPVVCALRTASMRAIPEAVQRRQQKKLFQFEL